jgi:hypothetical protein
LVERQPGGVAGRQTSRALAVPDSIVNANELALQGIVALTSAIIAW